MSVLLPVLDERSVITDCLDSLLAQDYPEIGEILVLDGGSSDGTRGILAGFGPPVRLITNPGVTAAAAMNVGLREAAHDVIVRADAHTLYAPDYVSRSVEALEASGADWVGGLMRPIGATSFGRAVAAVTSSPWGVGPGAFHYRARAGDVDTVYLGTFRRDMVREAGGYDAERIQWAAEDQELNFRLRRAGKRIRLDPAIRSWYFPRSTPGALARQYFNYGLCKASTLRKHRRLPTWRPLAPGVLVGATVAAAVLAGATHRPWVAVAPLGAYAVTGGAVAAHLSREPGVAPHRAFGAMAICQWSYGAGLWAGLLRIVSGRPFDAVPRGRR